LRFVIAVIALDELIYSLQTHEKSGFQGEYAVRHIDRVAIFHLRITPMSRAKGANALQAAARYAATVLVDHRTGEKYDFSADPGVVHQEIIGPGNADCFWQDRQSLWTAAERAEERKDARVAREYEIALPHELSATERIELARRWGKFVVERYRNVVDLTVRAPPPNGDPRNHYAKLLATTRQVSAMAFGGKTGIELPSGEQSGPKELRLLHRQWKQFVSEALQASIAA
jgi:uncharacterized protein YggU (UPF0235/DUF167 family)